ncbi:MULTISPECIES: biotin carboxylase N-terminal domain-containing protein [unclassified Limnobacter]|uniref:acetyl/propionyl/methylcrotonyl-CoA carboxylase subunit alpha n=1 Tax=unclassified Limnobacter TaxID=2630203 RepID=UPI0025BDFC06|nr:MULTISPECIES: biotin carboxylase N-terminal domain-containing protein [unclassified Limnobacter]|tara:strand:+ start:6911 stop:8962 length:2052 start_codon:yes stop_codon:yes gene_type:complete
MFTKILIANRGEIARRINRTAQAMGIQTVAVYSTADAKALHVQECNEAVCLGEPEAAQSYLNIDKVIAAARQTGAQAIHPGYGFLSENAAFAQACADANITFIGPGVEAIRIMGSKSEAKACVQPAGVPLIPGYFGADQSLNTLQAEAERIGFPLMIKAVAGGGGKGIRIVNSAAELQAALESCQREAKNAFGDATVMLEKQIIQPRHVEVQVFADTHGNVVHLFERDCSAQRRHQKVIEEAPAFGLTEAQREAFGRTAVQVAKAVNYVGAGTVEFLLDARGEFYFMEMNTRLQVEHPVTEMITGFDLVQWQIEIAAGLPLPATQETIHIDGHAFEARLYAENPEQGFLPAIGTVELWEAPDAIEFRTGTHAGRTAGIRLDSAMRSGLAVSPYYDPMVGKLITWAPTREAALNKLANALAQLRCVGVKNNLAWLRSLCLNPEFAAGGYDTGLIDRMSTPTDAPTPIDSDTLHALAGLARWALHQHQNNKSTQDPLATLDGFYSSSPPLREDRWFNRDTALATHTHVSVRGQQALVQCAGFALQLALSPQEQRSALPRLKGLVETGPHAGSAFDLIWHGDNLSIHVGAEQTNLQWQNPAHIRADQGHDAHGVAAPMPGKVFAVFVKVGDTVKKGQPLIGLEAMKMEHTLNSPCDGVVQSIPHPVGDQVTEGTELIHFSENDDSK